MDVAIHNVTKITERVVVHAKDNEGWEFTVRTITVTDEHGAEMNIKLFNNSTTPVEIYTGEMKEV